MLEEVEANYTLTLVDMKAGDQRQPEFKKINPLGKIPALVDEDLVICESAAICHYLAEKYPEKGLRSANLADYYRWSAYVYGSLEPPLIEYFLHKSPEAVDLLKGRLQVVEDLPGPYLCGEQFSTADVLMGSVLGWANMLGVLGDFPRLSEYLARLKARPAYQRAYKEAR